MTNSNIVRIVFLGKEKVGKTSFIQRILGERIDDQYVPTIGLDFRIYSIEDTKVQMWDCAGNDRFRFIIIPYLQNADMVVIMIDSTLESVQSLESYYSLIMSSQRKNDSEIIVFQNQQSPCSFQKEVNEFILDRRLSLWVFNIKTIPQNELEERFLKKIAELIEKQIQFKDIHYRTKQVEKELDKLLYDSDKEPENGCIWNCCLKRNK